MTQPLVVNEAVQVDQLIVPRQGCGLGPLVRGTPEFIAFIARKLRKGIGSGPHKKLYLSRLGYQMRRGGVFDEGRLERLLKREGYHIMRPKRLSLEEQISVCLGADFVISPDSSALHLLAMIAREDQKVAVILRLWAGGDYIEPNIAGFMGRRPLVIDQIVRIHRRMGVNNLNWASYAELDVPAVGAELASEGFIQQPEVWPALKFRRRRLLIETIEQQFGQKIEQLEPEGERRSG